MNDQKVNSDDILLVAGGKSGLKIKFVPKNFPFPKISGSLDNYKVLIPYAWGNMSEKSGLGGAYSDIIVAGPGVATTETYLESGRFSDEETANKHAKYLLTKFVRALLYFNKYSQHSTTSWGAIPVQDYSEDWWEESVEKINEMLMKKYNISEDTVRFVNENIQFKDENNIIEILNK